MRFVRTAVLVLRRNDRLRRALERISLGSGIVGIGLAQLAPKYPWIFWVSISVLVIALILDAVALTTPNKFTDKQLIDRTWQSILAGATDSISVVAGDASWAPRDATQVRQKVDSGVLVRVLCHAPRRNSAITRHTRVLLEAGAQVRWYSGDTGRHPFGLLVDAESPESATVLRLKRSAVQELSSDGRSQSIYDYRAVRFLPDGSGEDIITFAAMFEAMWDRGTDAILLEEIKDETSARELALGALKKVAQYERIDAGRLTIRSVEIGDLMASCHCVRQDKLDRVARLVQEYREQGLAPFVPARCLTNRSRCVVIPPICEEHDGKLVILDGTHRLFFAKTLLSERDATVLVLSGPLPPLPGIPCPFNALRTYPSKLPRPVIFNSYDERNWRGFKPMEHELCRPAETT